MRPALPLALVLAALALTGCLGEKSSPVLVTAFDPINDAQPGRWTEYAFRIESTLAFKQTLAVRAEVPAGWTAQPEMSEVTLTGRAVTSLVVRVLPDANATYAPTELSVFVGDTRARVIADVRDLGDEPARAGAGATILYAMWWDNGTLAATNDPALRNRTGIGPAAFDLSNGSFAPLKVYVGGERGVAPPEPYLGRGYEAVIPGIDERLRDAGDGLGMVAGDTLAATIPPEKGFAQPGDAGHPLAGARLHVLVRVVSVDLFGVL